jgi:osmotically-inducible protein OsmY
VNVESGVVYLRGEVDSPAERQRLETSARQINGVRDVVSMLHGPGEAAPTKETAAAGR